MERKRIGDWTSKKSSESPEETAKRMREEEERQRIAVISKEKTNARVRLLLILKMQITMTSFVRSCLSKDYRMGEEATKSIGRCNQERGRRGRHCYPPEKSRESYC